MLTWVKQRKAVIGVAAGAGLLMLVVLGPQTMFPFKAATSSAAAGEESSARSPQRTIPSLPQEPIELPKRKPTAKAYEAMLASDQASVRWTAINQLADDPTHEHVLLLAAHLEKETDEDVLLRLIVKAKRASQKKEQERVARRLVEMFEKAEAQTVRASVLAAFKLYPTELDKKHVMRLAKVAKPGQEQQKVEALRRMHEAPKKNGAKKPPTRKTP